MSYKTGFYEGRLGIGLGSTMGMGDGNPRYPLDINGDIRLTGSIVNGDGQVLSLVPAESLWTIGNNNLSYAGGNVGIGTQSPTTLLEIKGDGDANNNQIIIQSESYNKGILFKYKSATGTTYDFNQARIWTTGSSYDTKLHFSTAKNVPPSTTPPLNEAMTIDDVGNVGIGTTGPISKLSVYQGGITLDNTVATYTAASVAATANSLKPFEIRATTGSLAGDWGILRLRAGGGTYMTTCSFIDIVGFNSTDSTCIKFFTYNNERMRINSSGNVGIGTASPHYDLDIGADGGGWLSVRTDNNNSAGKYAYGMGFWNASNNYGLCFNAGGLYKMSDQGHTPQLFISAHTNNGSAVGNVGIGTTSPGYKLHIVNPTLNNSIQDLLCLETHANSQTTIGPAILFRERWNNGSYWNLARILAMEQAGYGGQLAFFTNLGDTGADDTLLERMRIDENGHVGIGTTTMNTTFNVSGSFYLSGYQSIGTTSILYPLWVASRSANPAQGGSKGAGRYFTDGGDLRSLSNWGVEYSNGYGGGGVATADAGKTSIRADGIIWSDIAVAVSSDSRIKKNIVDVPDHQALEMVRNIPCRYYEYIDNTFIKREGKTIGFIAQEVKDILPMAVNQETRFIPDVMKMLSVDNENIIDWTEHVDNSNNKIFKMKYDELGNVNNIEYKFYVADVSNNSSLEKIIIGNEDNTFTFEQKWNYVFCYGRKVDDFHILDKQKLFALNFSATQELDRKVIALENENAELKAELAAIKQHLGI